MKLVLFAQTALLFVVTQNALASIDYNCTGTVIDFRTQPVTEVRMPLKIEFENNDSRLLSGNVGDIYFSVSEQIEKESFLTSITVGPKFDEGINSTGGFGLDSRLQLSRVLGPLVSKLECIKMSK